MINLSQWTSGQVATSTKAIEAVIRANLKWQQNSLELQKIQIGTSYSAAKTTANATEASIQDEAESIRDQAIGSMSAGIIQSGVSAASMGVYSVKQNAELEPINKNLDTCTSLRELCRETPSAGVVAANAQDLQSSATAIEDKKLLMQQDSYSDPRVQEMSTQRRTAAFRAMDDAEQERVIENSHRAEYKISEQQNRVHQMYENKKQAYNNIAQSVGTITSSSGNMASAGAKEQQAKEEYIKALSNYISQSSSIANQMLGSQTSDAIAQKRAALDMEAQIAQAQSAAAAA